MRKQPPPRHHATPQKLVRYVASSPILRVNQKSLQMCLDAILTHGSQPHQRPSACWRSHLHSRSVRRDTKVRRSGSPAARDNAQRSRKPPIVGIWFKGQPRCNNVRVENARTQRAKTWTSIRTQDAGSDTSKTLKISFFFFTS